MRRFSLYFAAFMMISSGQVTPARAAGQCASDADQAVYDLLALRTAMIVLSLSCGREGSYNNEFIARFRPILQGNDHAVSVYFQRLYGRAGEESKDRFVTELANVMSQEAERRGVRTCANAARLYNEMARIRSPDQLYGYARARDLAPPSLSMCPRGR